MPKSEVTFGLVHGSWHGAWCWSLLQPELEVRGYKSLAMDLPIDDSESNFDDYADVVVDSLKDEAEVILVGHSRAGNVIPRAASGLATKKLIYLCGSFEPSTIGHPVKGEKGRIPIRNNQRFQQGLITLEGDLTLFDRHLAKELFFSDCFPEIKEWAADQLRPQRRSSEEPTLDIWPDTPQEYIICKDDLVVNPDWSRYVAVNWLGIKPIEIPGGHSPFLSKPQELASLLISLVE